MGASVNVWIDFRKALYCNTKVTIHALTYAALSERHGMFKYCTGDENGVVVTDDGSRGSP